MKDPSHRLFDLNWFIYLDNLFKVIVHYLLNGGMTCFGH